MVIVTIPDMAPFTIQRPAHPCTPMTPTQRSSSWAPAIEESGISARNAQPKRTRKLSVSMSSEARDGPIPSADNSGRHQP